VDLPVLLLGCILPDLFSRSFNVFLLSYVPLISDYTDPIHTPAMIVVYCLLVSLFFAAPGRRAVFFTLLSGSLLHLLFDLGQRNIGHGYMLLYPFSRWTPSWSLFWPESSLTLVPGLTVLLAAVLIYDWRKKRI
jgi:hypothetical protein